MKPLLYGFITSLTLIGAGIAQAEDAVAPPRTHVDSTVVGDAMEDNLAHPGNIAGLDKDHHFESGAPHLTALANRLNLSAHQKTEFDDIVERGDAAAAVFIKREHTVKEMLAATTPEDPMYAQLRAEQADAGTRWQVGRDAQQQQFRAILTPAQQAKLDQMMADGHSVAAATTAP